jgi:phosphatidylserine decarboxylase
VKKLSISFYMMLQRMLPQHLLSRLAGWLATRQSRWLRCTLISLFMAVYDIKLTEAKREKHDEYVDFNDFFARTLKPEARPIHAGESDVISPADGRVNTFGQLHDGTLIQAKGHQFALADIVADEKIASLFVQGYYASIYLAPHNYHRIHMPFAGELKQMIHVPGDLFAVNPTTMANMAVLARNERVICVFDTSYGEMAVIMVGAMIVGSIKTLWAGRVQGRQLQCWTYPPDQVTLAAGDDIGEFRLGGSMVIVLFANRGFDWQKHLVAGQAIQMGQHMGGFDRLAAQDADQTQQHKPSTASQDS